MDEEIKQYEDDAEQYEEDNYYDDANSQPGVVDKLSQSATHVAGKAAATYFGGAAGGKIYEVASNTAIGKAIEDKVAKKVSFKVKLILIGVGIAFFFLFFIIFAFFIDDGTFGDFASDTSDS